MYMKYIITVSFNAFIEYVYNKVASMHLTICIYFICMVSCQLLLVKANEDVHPLQVFNYLFLH